MSIFYANDRFKGVCVGGPWDGKVYENEKSSFAVPIVPKIDWDTFHVDDGVPDTTTVSDVADYLFEKMSEYETHGGLDREFEGVWWFRGLHQHQRSMFLLKRYAEMAELLRASEHMG